MAREEKCILTNMCMIYDKNRILVQDRKDPDWPGVTFPGGHIEPGESFVGSTIREIKEDAKNQGGVNIFGEKFGDFSQGLMYMVDFE